MMLLADLHLQLGRFALDTGAFELPLQGVTALFGPSGSGKSSLLRALAGLEPRARGYVRFGDEIWLDARSALPAHRRGVGLVFQDSALFPHLNVRGNLDYARRRAGADHARLHETAAQTGIDSLLERAVDTLSGGERQRVAIGRALLSRPRLLCMDEPLAALDRRARAGLLDLIEQIARADRLPVLYVTHSAHEVERLAERVLFLRDGRLDGIASLRDALAQLDSPLFDDEGPASVLDGRRETIDGDGLLSFVTSGGVRLRLARPHDRGTARAVRLRVAARDVSLALHELRDISVLNQLPAAIEDLGVERDGRVVARLRLADGQSLLADITAYSARSLRLARGQPVYALIKSVALIE